MLKINLKNKFLVTLIVVAVMSVSINIFQAVSAATSAPGSTGDPIVSKSYVDAKVKTATTSITALQTKLTAAQKDITEAATKITDLNSQITSLKSQVAALKAAGYKVVTIEAGKKVIVGSSTEMILRSGKATAISGTGGGLSDVTVGKDLVSGNSVTANHLLISSKNDGRGLNCITKCYIIIRGSYKV